MEDSQEVSIKLDTLEQKIDTNSMTGMLSFAEQVLKSGLKPTYIKTPQDVVSAIIMGRELGFSPFVSMNNIYPIEGKPTVGVHLFTALALKNKTTYEILDDFKPIHSYTDSMGNSYETSYLKDNKDTYFVAAFAPDKIPKGFKPPEGKVVVWKSVTPIDYITRIRFDRVMTDGKIWTITHSYKYSEAVQAGLANKDNWKKQPKTMTRTRCLVAGIKLIGGDYTQGLVETTEMADSVGKVINIDEEGKVINDPN